MDFVGWVVLVGSGLYVLALAFDLLPDSSTPAAAERLVRGEGRRGQQVNARRQVEGVAVPVQHGHIRRQLSQRRALTFGGKRNRRPPQLFVARVHPATQGAGHELSAQTNAQRRPVGCQPPLKQAQLRYQEWV